MSAVLNEAPAESTALTVQARASLALGAAEHEKRLIALAAGSTAIIEIRDSASYAECHGARMSLKRARLEIEGLGEGAREDARNFAKAVIAEQKRLVAIVEPEELRLQEIERAHDAKVEAEKEAKRQAEQNRIAMIQHGIQEIRQYEIDASGDTADHIAFAMDLLEQFPIDERFAEFRPDAEQVKVATMNRLNEMHAQAVEREAAAKAESDRLAAEQARIKAEREELERQKAAQAERDRIAREDMERRQAEQDARERAERERVEAARISAENEERRVRAQREADEAASKARIEARERAAAELRAKADAEAMALRVAEEERLRSIREAEEKRIVAEREKLERERLAKEKRDKEAADKIEAKARAKREKEEAAERERQRKAQEKMDARELARTFVERFGHLPEWADTVKAINLVLATRTEES